MDQRHSGFGIASFVISALVGVVMFLLFIIAGMMELSTPGGLDESSAGAMFIGLLMIVLMIMDVVAGALGIVGLTQHDRKKVFPILGVVFATATVIGTLFLVIIGNMM